MSYGWSSAQPRSPQYDCRRRISCWKESIGRPFWSADRRRRAGRATAAILRKHRRGFGGTRRRHRVARTAKHEEERDRSERERPEAEVARPDRERRQALAAFDAAFEDAHGERRQRMRDRAAVVDDDGGAGVGRTDHRPLQLERAHPRDAQVLLDGDRLAEPADVADVGEDRRRTRLGYEPRRQLLAEQVLVADVRRDALAADVERRRRERAALEVA